MTVPGISKQFQVEILKKNKYVLYDMYDTFQI